VTVPLNHLCVDLYSGDAVTSFADAYAAGVRLIIHKASEGSTYRDPTHAERRIAARAAGLMWASYHFLRASPVDAQVANFLSVAKPDDDTRLVMDWETTDASVAIAREFLLKLDAKTGRKTVVYSYASFLQEHLGATADPIFADHPLWIAAYSSHPPKLQASWQKYLLWQNTETARIPGIPGTSSGVDASHFDGTADELRTAWLGNAPVAAQPAPPAPLPEPWDHLDWPISPRGSYKLAWVQDGMNRLYPGAPLFVDGLDGPLTRNAVRAFQRAHNLHEDGVAGERETIPALKAALAASHKGTP
jgi:lysozyme